MAVRRVLIGCVVVVVVAIVSVFAVGHRSGPGRPQSPVVAGPTPQLPPDVAPASLLAADNGTEPLPDPAVLGAQLDLLSAAPGLGPALSARVVDVDTGTVLYDRGSTEPVTPASTAKLLTAAAALTTIEPGTTFRTRVLAGTAPGQIVLVGGGDPTLSSAPTSTLYPGAATVAELAAGVAASGIGPVTQILVDSALFVGAETAPGWGSADAPSSYAAPITATMVDGGRIDPAAEQRTGTPDLAAGQALADALGDTGISVALAGPGATAVPAVTLADVHSAPIDRLAEQMLRASDNVLAEVVGRQTAIAAGQPASFAGAVAAIRTAVGALGVDLSAVTLADASGLSTLDRLTPAVLTAVLLAAVDPADPRDRPLLAGLPVAGYDGTLVDRYVPAGSAGGAGDVRAKTGTLDGVSALAGLVQTADGRLLAFALLAEAVPIGGNDAAELGLDALATALASCGCP